MPFVIVNTGTRLPTMATLALLVNINGNKVFNCFEMLHISIKPLFTRLSAMRLRFPINKQTFLGENTLTRAFVDLIMIFTTVLPKLSGF